MDQKYEDFKEWLSSKIVPSPGNFFLQNELISLCRKHYSENVSDAFIGRAIKQMQLKLARKKIKGKKCTFVYDIMFNLSCQQASVIVKNPADIPFSKNCPQSCGASVIKFREKATNSNSPTVFNLPEDDLELDVSVCVNQESNRKEEISYSNDVSQIHCGIRGVCASLSQSESKANSQQLAISNPSKSPSPSLVYSDTDDGDNQPSHLFVENVSCDRSKSIVELLKVSVT